MKSGQIPKKATVVLMFISLEAICNCIVAEKLHRETAINNVCVVVWLALSLAVEC